MDKDQVIAGMKKNWVSILLGVVALLAIGVMLFWINGRYDELEQEVEARAGRVQEIRGLLEADRPNLQFTVGGGRTGEENLDVFPTEDVIRSGREVMGAVKEQAGEVLRQAVEMNRRVPLGQSSYDEARRLWPLEGDRKQVDRERYRREYQQWINYGNGMTGESYPPNTLQGSVNATRPPSREELESKQEGYEMRLLNEVEQDPQGRPLEPEAFRARLETELVVLANQLRYDRALNHLLYIDANGSSSGLTVHPIVDAENPTAEDCFNAQVTLWVQEAVAENLLRANVEALGSLSPQEQNILNAPVKHLVYMNVPIGFTDTAAIIRDETTTTDGARGGDPYAGQGYGGGYDGGYQMVDPGIAGGAGMGTPDMGPPPEQRRTEQRPSDGRSSAAVRRGGGRVTSPDPEEDQVPAVEVPVDPAATIERQFEYSPSGRPLHTPFYDVVQFNLTLRCDAASVPYVLNQLQRRSFVTVLNVDMATVDLDVAAEQGYVYGDRPVVELDLQCEMVFLRPWTVPLMPTGLREALLEWEQ